jgi:ATP-binding cassette subfamily B multidrug efflux pump
MPHLRRLLPALARHRRAVVLGLLALLATTGLSVAGPWVLRHAIDDLTVQVTRGKLWVYAAAIVGLIVGEGFFRYHQRMVLIRVSRELEYELRNDVFRHLTLLSPRYYQQHRIGEVMSRATNDMSAVRMVLGPGIMYTASTVATFVGAVTLMLAISPRLTGLALVPLVLVSWLVRHYGRQVHDRFEQVQAQLADMNALVQENLAGARVVRAYVQEAHEEAHFAAANEEYVSRNRRLVWISGVLNPGINFLMGLGALTVLWLGGRMVVAGTITLGEFVAFGAYLAMLNWPMIALGWVVNLVERGEASMGRNNAILDAAPEIGDVEPLPVTAIRGDVEFRNLTFSYDGVAVLQDVDLRVPAGTTVAVVGPTGSGKSTLVGLIPRLFDAPPGAWTPFAAPSGSCPRRASSSPRRCGRTWPSGRGPRAASSGRRGWPSSRRTCATSRRVSRRPWGSAGSPSPAGRSSAPPSPGPSPRTRASSSSTTPSPRSTPRPRSRSWRGCGR